MAHSSSFIYHVQGMSDGVQASREMQASADSSFASLVAFFGEDPKAMTSAGDFFGPVIAFAKQFIAAQDNIYIQRKASLVIGALVHPSLHTYCRHCFSYHRVM